MPKGANQKLKLYYLARIMVEKTDDSHALTMAQIQEHLLMYGVTADRKSIYDDMEALRVLGIDVMGEKEGRNYYYHVGGKKFEVAELKLLVDAIQSSKFITEKKSDELIRKLTGLVSEYEADQLKREVVVKGRIKTMNESIYYIVDDIHNAMMANRKIQFDYLKWNAKKEMVKRKDEPYEASPWALTWDDENYYLIAYESGADMIKHYRVDKMKNIRITDEMRDGREHFDRFDMAAYAKMNFGMFSGDEMMIRLEFSEDMAGVVLDRFGSDITIIASNERKGWYETHVKVALSDQFFGWVFSLGSGVMITGPDEAVKQFASELAAMNEMYAGRFD
ncbi:MAG: WYL domain-containing protein [Lachnospiraceae bacterium]|nr:WYL domain-containing protein [Lachnospiraceae bacterium]